jgi:hypothetical protein
MSLEDSAPMATIVDARRPAFFLVRGPLLNEQMDWLNVCIPNVFDFHLVDVEDETTLRVGCYHFATGPPQRAIQILRYMKDGNQLVYQYFPETIHRSVPKFTFRPVYDTCVTATKLAISSEWLLKQPVNVLIPQRNRVPVNKIEEFEICSSCREPTRVVISKKDGSSYRVVFQYIPPSPCPCDFATDTVSMLQMGIFKQDPPVAQVAELDDRPVTQRKRFCCIS